RHDGHWSSSSPSTASNRTFSPAISLDLARNRQAQARLIHHDAGRPGEHDDEVRPFSIVDRTDERTVRKRDVVGLDPRLAIVFSLRLRRDDEPLLDVARDPKEVARQNL